MRRLITTAWVMLSIALMAGPAVASSAALEVSRGNEAFDKGEFDEAMSSYERASVDEPESAEILFNKGTVHYRREEYADARKCFEGAGVKTRDLSLEARCQYNLGNVAFREGQRQTDSDLQKALESHQAAVRHYGQALELDSDMGSAARNIEVTRLVMKDILDRIKKQAEEAAKRAEQQKELQEKLKELAEKQEALNEKSEQLQSKAEEARKAEAEKLGEEQAENAAATKELADKMAEALKQSGQSRPTAGEKNPIDEAKEHLGRSVAHQSDAEAELGDNQPEEAIPSQEQALEELKEAQEALSGRSLPQRGEGQRQQQESQPQQEQESEGEQQEARQLDEKAEDILDEEKDNRERRRVRTSGGYKPVDKDW